MIVENVRPRLAAVEQWPTDSASLLLIAVVGAVVALGAGALLAADGRVARRRRLAKDFRGPGFYLSWIKILACWLRVPALGENHRLGQHRLPGVEAGLPALEPDRLRHASWRRSCWCG